MLKTTQSEYFFKAFENNELTQPIVYMWVQKKRETFFKTPRLAFFYLRIIISINKKPIKRFSFSEPTLIFTLVFEIVRSRMYLLTDIYFDKIINISKNIIFSMFAYLGFLQTEMPWFCTIFLIQIDSAVFEIFRKIEAKKNNTFYMHDYLQYLNMPCMVK